MCSVLALQVCAGCCLRRAATAVHVVCSTEDGLRMPPSTSNVSAQGLQAIGDSLHQNRHPEAWIYWQEALQSTLLSATATADQQRPGQALWAASLPVTLLLNASACHLHLNKPLHALACAAAAQATGGHRGSPHMRCLLCAAVASSSLTQCQEFHCVPAGLTAFAICMRLQSRAWVRATSELPWRWTSCKGRGQPVPTCGKRAC